MSAMTAPMDWRRTLAAILRRREEHDVGIRLPDAGWPGCIRIAGGRGGRRSGRRVRVQARGVLKDPFLECLGTKQAAGDPREDARDVDSGEAAYEREVSGFATLAEGGGEFLAVADELADEAEKAACAGEAGCWGGDGAGHGQIETTDGWSVSRNIFRDISAVGPNHGQ